MPAVAARVASFKGWRRAAAAVVAGAVTALAQPPVSQPAVLFLALPVLAWLIDGTRGSRAAFVVGWLAGAGHFAAALFWIVDPFLVQPEVHGWMAPFALAGMAGGMALFWAAPFALARAWPPGLPRLLALAALWTLSDFLRSHVLGGFPWGLVAYAWVDTPVIQTAAFFGPHLLGLLTLVAALLPATGRPAGIAVAVALVAAGWGFGAWRLAQPVEARDPRFVVRLVQPDADQRDKWRPGMEQLFYERHLALTAAPAEPAPDVTIWSETAVPFLLDRDRGLLAESAAAAAPGRLILGIRRAEGGPDGETRWFNSLAVLGRGRRHRRGLRQAPPRALRRVHPARRAAAAPRDAGIDDADRERLLRRSRADGRGGAGRPAVPAADLLRGDLPARPEGAGGTAGMAGPGDERRLVRHGVGPLPASRAGAGPGDRAGSAAGSSGQYRH